MEENHLFLNGHSQHGKTATKSNTRCSRKKLFHTITDLQKMTCSFQFAKHFSLAHLDLKITKL